LYILSVTDYLAEQFIPKLTELLSLGVCFAGVALDNENTENAFFDRLQEQFEFLLHIPCSSHVIQLVVRNILKHASIQKPLQKMIEILNEISSKKELRLKVLNMAKTENINIVLTKPNATRWNSTVNSVRRFIVFKKVINYFKGNLLLPLSLLGHVLMKHCVFMTNSLFVDDEFPSTSVLENVVVIKKRKV
jgi:hypothetical protein